MNDRTAALIELLRTSKRPQTREMAVRELVDIGDLDAVPALLDVLENTTDLRLMPVVTAALTGLQRMGPAIAPYVEQRLGAAADPQRAFMPMLLASSLGTGAVPRLLEALGDAQRDVQINAATHLGLLRDERAYEPLAQIVGDESQDAALRGAAAGALGALRDPRALPVLLALAQSSQQDLLAGAIDGLADLRMAAGIPTLEALLDRPALDDRTTRAVKLALLALERYRDR